MRAHADTLVIGAGISGLAYAHARRGDDVLVLEASDEAGGLIRTAEVAAQVRVRHELGPESLAPGAHEVAELAESLGVARSEAGAATRARFVVHRGRLVRAPDSPPALLRTPLLSLRGKLRLLLEPWRAPRELDGSIAAFARHRLGREALAALVDPMVAGIHAGEPEQLSMRACFPRAVAWVEQHGSIFAALRAQRCAADAQAPRLPMWKPRGGMQRLTDALARVLGESLRCGVAVNGLEASADGYRARTSAGEVQAARVVLAVPLAAARVLLTGVAPAAAAALADMQSESLVGVAHAYRRADVEHDLAGFGYLVPAREGLRHLGTLFSSTIDPECAESDVVLLRTLLGGARDPEIAGAAEADILRVVAAEVAPLVGVRRPPQWAEVRRYPHALPRFDLRHPERRRALARALPPGLSVLGNFTAGIGLPALVAEASALAARTQATRAQAAERDRGEARTR
jgi:oxygen-dependent protoporphyrinogen oxidase